MKNAIDIVSSVICTEEKLKIICKELIRYEAYGEYRQYSWLWTKCINELVKEGYDEMTSIKLVEIVIKTLALRYVINNV